MKQTRKLIANIAFFLNVCEYFIPVEDFDRNKQGYSVWQTCADKYGTKTAKNTNTRRSPHLFNGIIWDFFQHEGHLISDLRRMILE